MKTISFNPTYYNICVKSLKIYLILLILLSCSLGKTITFKNDLEYEAKLIIYIRSGSSFFPKSKDVEVIALKRSEKNVIYLSSSKPWDSTAINQLLSNIDSVTLSSENSKNMLIKIEVLKNVLYNSLKKRKKYDLKVKFSELYNVISIAS